MSTQTDWFDQNAPKGATQDDWFSKNAPPAASASTKSTTATDTPSAPSRFASSFTESFGAPANIHDWPKAVNDLTNGPVPQGMDPTGGALNPAINIGKGIVNASRDAARTGLDRMKQPGLMNKFAGGLDIAESGIPVIGPSVVKASEQFGKGDYAGGFGTMTGTALQILSGDPNMREAVASVPSRVGGAVQTAARGTTGVGAHPVEVARRAWAQETLEAQAKHETKTADLLASHKDETLEAYLDQAQKIKKLNEDHAQNVAKINAKHADAISKVQASNAQAKSEFDSGQDQGKAASQHAQTLADNLPVIKDKANAAARAAYPTVDGTADPAQLYQELNTALDASLRGTNRAPASLGRIISDTKPKEAGLTVMGQQLDPSNPLHAQMLDKLKGQGVAPEGDTPLTFDKLHGYYSEMGRELYQRDLPGDEATSLREGRAVVLKHMQSLARNEGKLAQFEKAQEGWKTYENTFNNSSATANGGSPIARALKTRDPITGKLRPEYVQQILSEPKANKVAQDLLSRYAPTDSLKGLASSTEAVKAAPKKLKVTPEPAAPTLPTKPAAPSPKLPPPPDFPDRPQIEPFDAQQHRADMLEKAAMRASHMSTWEWRSIGVGFLEMLLGQHPYTWSYPATMRARYILMSNPRISRWIAAEHPEWIKNTTPSTPAISPLTQPSPQQKGLPAPPPAVSQ